MPNHQSELGAQIGGIKMRAGIADCSEQVRAMDAMLEAVPLWQPARGLRMQCQEVMQALTDLEARFAHKLVVTLIGPSGSGKSTLLNALAGVDDLSPTGHQRPTTRGIVVLSRRSDDPAQLLAQLGAEQVDVRTSPAADALRHVILIDTPDTDSTEQAVHVPLVHKAISLSDVLLCVFDAQNPKRRDQADFLAPYLQRFDGDSCGIILNKCDRLAREELLKVVVPEFKSYLENAWQGPIADILCISGRRNLRRPNWDPGMTPRHDFDQFDQLREMVFGLLNSPRYAAARRLENAKQLRAYMAAEIQAEARADRRHLLEGQQGLRRSKREALQNAATHLLADSRRRTLGVNVLLYQKLSQNWLGPVGWLVAIWARILLFGTGLAALLRPGNPIRQLWGLVSSWRRYRESRAALEESGQSDGAEAALGHYRLILLQNWPDIASALIRGRFDPAVRSVHAVLPEGETLSNTLGIYWESTLNEIVAQAARRLSHLLLQGLFNLPVVAFLGYVGYLTVTGFLAGQYLSADFFLHAFVACAICLVLSFFILQALIRLAARPQRLSMQALQTVRDRIEQVQPPETEPIDAQVSAVLDLAAEGNQSPE